MGGEGGGRKRGGQTPQPPAPLEPLSRARTKNSHRIVLRQQSIIYTSHVTDQRGIYTTHHNIRLLSPLSIWMYEINGVTEKKLPRNTKGTLLFLSKKFFPMVIATYIYLELPIPLWPYIDIHIQLLLASVSITSSTLT